MVFRPDKPKILKESSFKPLVDPLKNARPLRWESVFAHPQPVIIEIGSGTGEYIVENALAKKNYNFLGIELQWKRIHRTLRKIDIAAARKEEGVLDNLRLVRLDAWTVFERLCPSSSIEEVDCLFPCPWPKDRHQKHRLFSRTFLKLVNNRLKDNKRLRIVTDLAKYKDWILNEAAGTGFRVDSRIIQPQFQTKFERKWCMKGQKEFYEIQMTKDAHQDYPVKKDVDVPALRATQFNPSRLKLEDVKGAEVVIFKDFLFDPHQQRGMINVVVAEENLTQRFWIAVEHTQNEWLIRPENPGSIFLTEGVVHALRMIHWAVEKTIDPT